MYAMSIADTSIDISAIFFVIIYCIVLFVVLLFRCNTFIICVTSVIFKVNIIIFYVIECPEL